MRITRAIIGGALVSLLTIAAVALPAGAATTTKADRKGDVQTSATATDGTVSPDLVTVDDPSKDIIKVRLAHTSTDVIATVTFVDLKKKWSDTFGLSIRTSKSALPDYSVSKSLLGVTFGTGVALDDAPKGVTVKIKPGKKGTYTVTIPREHLGDPKRVSVSASLVAIDVKTFQITADTLGPDLEKAVWTKFVTAG